jgi:signal transduction histidine kinase
LEIKEHSCQVAGDAKRLEQVLGNLLNNALKYSPAGGEITVRLDGTPNDGVLLMIRDAGIGVPEGSAATIFEPFGRAANVAAAHLPGMGLGLYICREIVGAHGGRIWAESPGVGQGTSLFVSLPRLGPEESANSDV